MDGFIIKCNICGKESVWGSTGANNTVIELFPGYEGEVEVICDCGNKVNK